MPVCRHCRALRRLGLDTAVAHARVLTRCDGARAHHVSVGETVEAREICGAELGALRGGSTCSMCRFRSPT